MPTASWALQRAIHAALTDDPALTALLGGAHVYDHVPRGTSFPYVTFGWSTERDWSTGSEPGHEHIVVLHVWSQARGRRQIQAIVSVIRARLHAQALALDGHALINLRHEATEIRRDPDGETLRGLIRLRGVTEPV